MRQMLIASAADDALRIGVRREYIPLRGNGQPGRPNDFLLTFLQGRLSLQRYEKVYAQFMRSLAKR